MWRWQRAEGTPEPTVVPAQEQEGRSSEVLLNGVAVSVAVRKDFPFTHDTEGRNFRALVTLVPERFDVARLASFSGAYAAKEKPFEVTEVSDDATYDVGYLKAEVGVVDVPESLRHLIGPVKGKAQPPVKLTAQGFEVAGKISGSRLIPLPLDMPEVSTAAEAVRDATTGTLYGVTKDREGLIIAYSEADKSWRVVTSMDENDAKTVFMDEVGRRLIMPMDLAQRTGLAILYLDDGDDALVDSVDMDELIGLNDIYDPANELPPTLVAVGIDGDMLLLIATKDQALVRLDPSVAKHWRAYLVDVTTGEVDLVGYSGAPYIGKAGEAVVPPCPSIRTSRCGKGMVMPLSLNVSQSAR